MLLEVVNLNRFFGGLHAVRDVSFGVKEGAIMALIGPNGAGKTTLFNVISGTFPPHSGKVLYRGKDITGRQPCQVASLGLARTFQTTRLFPHMTVLENVMVGRHTRSRTGFIGGMLNLPGKSREERAIREQAREMLAMFGLADRAEDSAGNLPFGLQRSLEFARALAMDPSLVLLDEPAAGLNIAETEQLGGLITRIRARGITILIVEHDMSLVMDISDRIVVLDHGQKIAEGAPREVRMNPEVIRRYLGDIDA